MKHIRFLAVAALCCISTVSAAQQAAPEGVRERIYLSTDKDTYLAGEMLWFSAFTTDESGLPIGFSKVGYVELLDRNTPKEQVSFDLDGGKGNGCMVLPATLETGYYRLVAYTKNMRNESPVPLFEKLVAVANVSSVMESRATEQEYTPAPEAKLSGQAVISLSPDKDVYGNRETVVVSIEGLPDDIHSLSVSVKGDPYIPHNSGDILSWSSEARTSTPGVVSRTFVPELEGPIISGQIVDQASGQPVSSRASLAPYVSFASGITKIFGGSTDQTGLISFYTRDVTGLSGIVSTITGDESDKYRVDIQPPYIPYTQHQTKAVPYLNSLDADTETLLGQSIAMQVTYAYAGDSIRQFSGSVAGFHKKPDHVYTLAEYAKFPTMQETVTEILTPLRFRNIDGQRYLFVASRQAAGFPLKNTLVMIDGIPVFDHAIIYDYNPILLESVEIYRDQFIIGGRNFEGIVVFRTPGNNYPELTPDKQTYFFEYNAPLTPRVFYSPQHPAGDTEENRTPDFRHTLYWNPEVRSGSVVFNTSDLRGNYTAVAEGITDTGVTVRAEAAFRVE